MYNGELDFEPASVPPDNRKQQLVDMFPDYDIDAVLTSFPRQSVEHIANWILNTPTAPKKRRGHKRKASDTISQDDEADDTDDDELLEGLLLHKLLKDLYSKYKKKENFPDFIFLPLNVRSTLAAVFPSIRMDFINKIYQHNHNILSTLIGCWFIANRCTQKLQEFINEPELHMWLLTDPIQTRRRRKIDLDSDVLPHDVIFVDSLQKGIVEFKKIMKNLTKKYPKILNGTRLLPEAYTLQIEIPDDVEIFECSVCFTRKPIARRIMCGNAETENKHSFCRSCLRGHASAASEDMPLAEGAVGLKCMDYECKNAIFYSTVRSLIPKEIRKRIDSRILEENIGCAGLELERCRECNYAVEMEQSKEENKVFDCLNCEISWCRLCHRRWDDDHVGISCKELDEKNKVDRKQRDLEAKLNEVVVRKCHKCGLQFTKADGCNKMKCRCGATQCYVCKKTGIDYSHFCQHLREPGDKQCSKCNKPTCLLWEDARKRDEAEIEKIQQSAEIPINRPESPTSNNDAFSLDEIRRRTQHRLQRLERLQNMFNEREHHHRHNFPQMPLLNVQIAGPANVEFQRGYEHNPYRFLNPLFGDIPPPPEMPYNVKREVQPTVMPYNVNQYRQENKRPEFLPLNGNRNDRMMIGNDNVIYPGRPEFAITRNANQQLEPTQPILNGLNNYYGRLRHDIFGENTEDEDSTDSDEVPSVEELEEVTSDEDRQEDEDNSQNDDILDQQQNEGQQHQENSVVNEPNEVVVNDDENDIQVVNEIRPAILNAINRLGNGATVYELAPINEHVRYFDMLVNDCNSVLDFAVNQNTNASDIFHLTVINNNPELEGTEIENILGEYMNKQREFAEKASQHKEENLRLLERLRNATNNDNKKNNKVNKQNVTASSSQSSNTLKIENGETTVTISQQFNPMTSNDFQRYMKRSSDNNTNNQFDFINYFQNSGEINNAQKIPKRMHLEPTLQRPIPVKQSRETPVNRLIKEDNPVPGPSCRRTPMHRLIRGNNPVPGPSSRLTPVNRLIREDSPVPGPSGLQYK